MRVFGVVLLVWITGHMGGWRWLPWVMFLRTMNEVVINGYTNLGSGMPISPLNKSSSPLRATSLLN